MESRVAVAAEPVFSGFEGSGCLPLTALHESTSFAGELGPCSCFHCMDPRTRQTMAHRELLLPRSQQTDEPLFKVLGICVLDTRSWKLWLCRGGHQLFLWPLVLLGSAKRNATTWRKTGRQCDALSRECFCLPLLIHVDRKPGSRCAALGLWNLQPRYTQCLSLREAPAPIKHANKTMRRN